MGTQRMYRVKGLRNSAFPSDLMNNIWLRGGPGGHSAGAAAARQPCLITPVDSVAPPEGFGPMSADASRGLFFVVLCNVSGID